MIKISSAYRAGWVRELGSLGNEWVGKLLNGCFKGTSAAQPDLWSQN